MCGAVGPAGAKALRLDYVAWWRADLRTLRGAGPACCRGGEGRGWVFIGALSPSSFLQGSFPQPLPVDVMAAPALSWCLSVLIFLLSLDIPQVSTAVNGEAPGNRTMCFPSGRRPRCFYSPPGTPASWQEIRHLGREAGRRKAGAMGPEIRYPPPHFTLHPAPTVSTRLPKPRQDAGFSLLPCFSLPVGTLQAMGLSFVL